MTATDDPRLRLARPGPGTHRWLFVLAVPLPLAIATASIVMAVLRGSHLALAGDSRALTIAMVLGGTLVAGTLLWCVCRWALGRLSLRVDGGILDMRAAFYRYRIPLADLDLQRARVVDLDERPQLRPGLLSNNTMTLPGFRAGWFRLGNRRFTFVAIVDGRRKLWLPSTGRRDLLIEPRDPAAALERLRELAPPPRRA